VSAPSGWVVAASCERGLEDTPPELTAADERHSVFFDGVLYERERLERELDISARPARTDAERVLAAYGRWGDATPERLNGTFTIVVWSATGQTLQAVRDPLGIQPLFRYETGETVLFSNSLEALTRDRRVRATVSPIALAARVARRMPYQAETFYSDVKRVPQGHVWRRASGVSDLRRYWDPRPPGEHVVQGDPIEPEEFDALLERAVTRRLSGDLMGIYLSGGVDSVAVAAYAADLERRRDRTPLALSLVIPGEEVVDGETQRAVANSLGLQQILLPLEDRRREDGILGAALALAADFPAPLLNPWLPGFLRLNDEAAARGCRTILTGNGGDEWLTTPILAADLIRQLRFGQLAAFAADYRRSYGQSDWRVAKTIFWQFGLRPLLIEGTQPFLERRARPLLRRRLGRLLPTWLVPDRALRRELFDRPTSPPPSAASRSLYLRAASKIYDHPLQDSDMEEIFEAARRSGIRLVHPFCDLDLIALRYQARPEDLNRGGRPKAIVREALDHRSPVCASATQKKVAAANFFSDLLRREGPRVLKRLGRMTALAELGVVDPILFETDFDQMARNRDPRHFARIWDVLTLESWLRSHA
jgi:Asparagine synthase/Glutamine amidotransferase domain